MEDIAFDMQRKIYLFFLSLIVLFSVFNCNGCVFHQEAVDYLNQFDRIADVAVTDCWQSFCYDNKTTNVEEKFKEDTLNRIDYIDENFIYVISYHKESDRYFIYKSNYEFSEVYKIYEFSADGSGSFKFLNSDLFFYRYDDLWHLYEFSINAERIVDESYENEYKKIRNKYTVSKKINAYSSNAIQFSIVDNSTSIKKTIDMEAFMEVEPAKYLKEKNSFSLYDIYAEKENVYIIGRTNGCVIIFQYFFENNSIKYYSWLDDSQLYREPRYFYFFD